MKKTINQFFVFFKESSLFVRLLIVVTIVGAVAGTATVAAMIITPAPSDNKLSLAATESKDEQKTNEQEPAPISDDEKPDETAPNPPAQQVAPPKPAPTPAEPPKDDNTVTVEDIPKDLFGWSEYHAFKRRIEVGKPDAIKGMVAGHLFANYYCRQQSTTTSPSKYAIACLLNGTRGHMAFVEDVNNDDSIRVTEMNYEGWNRVSERVIPKDQAANYRYIP